MTTTRKGESAGGTIRTASNDIGASLINETIREELKRAVKERKIKHGTIAEETGLNVTTIRRILSGYIVSPPFDKLFILASYLGVKLPEAAPIQAKFTIDDLVKQGATLMSYPNLPSDSDRKKAESLLRALLDAKVLNVRVA